jgi:hypothetical protein
MLKLSKALAVVNLNGGWPGDTANLREDIRGYKGRLAVARSGRGEERAARVRTRSGGALDSKRLSWQPRGQFRLNA